MSVDSRSHDAPPAAPRRRPHAVELELFTGRFAAIATEMGEMLQRTALSTNVRDRLDFSCALLDAEGRLVVNAPHIPVHLGALGLCVRRVREVLTLEPGDAVVTNHPGHGGSHLPDVTVLAPVHDAEGVLLGHVASRAHHAELGGLRPGSMPPSATCLAEEGVVLPPTYLVRAGDAGRDVVRRDAVRALLTAPPHPSRAPDENLADLDAQLAAVRRGATLLAELAAREGAARTIDFLGALRRRAASKAEAALRRLGERLGPAPRVAEERLDDGTPLRVTITVDDGRARFDFTGTGAVHPGNLNATPAIVQSAVLYVVRLLVAEDLPLNEGLLERVTIELPPGSLLDPPFGDDPARAPAVVGGNVETSQRLVDALLRALELAACSQGTMNNLLFGDDSFGYYETICGGAGATARAAGASAVHTHMTNTRITDPEILEHRYPVRLERFAVRRGSGGAGRHRGGDGVVRELTFLRPVRVSFLSQHRVEAPYGLEGGGAGARGRQRLVRAADAAAGATGESVEELDGIAQADAAAGDRLIVETPGGGGWGQTGRQASRRSS